MIQFDQLKNKIQSENGFIRRDRSYLYKTYKNCFIGYEAVDWLYSNCPNMTSREDAVKIGQQLLDEGVICSVVGSEPFKDDYIFYEFEDTKVGNLRYSSTGKNSTFNKIITTVNSINSQISLMVPLSSSPSSSLTSSNEKNRRTSQPPPVFNQPPNGYNSNSYNKKHHRYSINDLQKVVLEDLNTVTLVKDELIMLSQELMNGDKGVKLQKKKKGNTTIQCFSGSQLVDWLVKKLEISRKECTNIGSALMHLNIFIEVGPIIGGGGVVMSGTLSSTIPSSISLNTISSTSNTSSTAIPINNNIGNGNNINITNSSFFSPLSSSSSSVFSSSPSSGMLSLSTSSLPGFDNRTMEDSNEIFYEFLTKPEAIINHVSMKKLDDLCLAHKSVQTIPTTIINTSKYLRILDLSFNQLSDFHQLESIATLYNLESLNLSHNQLSNIPSSFSRLELLSKLNLNHNNFVNIPIPVYQLFNLEELSVSGNQLTSITDMIGQLRLLERIDLRNNKISKIPKELGLLVRLKSFNVSGYNKITELPPFLSTLPQLEVLEFNHDTVKSPPKEITSKGFTHIIGYLKDLFEGTETLPYIKLMILGREKSGRSSLAKALSKSQTKSLSKQSASFLKKVTSAEVFLNEPIEINELKLDLPSESFYGIPSSNSSNNLTSLNSSGSLMPPPSSTPSRKDSLTSTPEKKRPQKRSLKLMIYDFKMPSLDVYYHTHQFFLSERAFYLITFDITKDIRYSGIDFWVDSIKKKTRDAPIYIVATHIDCFNQYGGDIMVPLNEVEGYLNQHSLEVTGVIGVSSTTLRNIDLLKQEIIKTLLNQQQQQQSYYGSNNNNPNSYWINERIPSIYLTLESNLQEEAKKRPIVSWEEYQNIAKLSNFTSPQSYEKLIRATNTLNRWGSIVWFEDAKSSLKDIVILDPQWLSDCFFKLLMAKHQYINSDGILLLSSLKNVWKPNIVPEIFHIKLLKLLERYQILYTLKNNSNVLQPSNHQSPTISPNTSIQNMAYSLESRSISSPLPTVSLSAEISSNLISNSSQSAFILPDNNITTTTGAMSSASPKLLRNSLKNLKSTDTSSVNSSNPLANSTHIGINLSSQFISFNRIIIPCLLPSSKPSHLSSLWDTWSGEEEHQIGRYFQFKNSPKTCFDRLMVRFLYMMEPIVYWSSGILFRKHPTYKENIKDSLTSCGTLVEFDPSTQQLQIRVRGHEFEACAKLFQIILENVDTILKDYQINQTYTFIPCSCSSECRDLPHLYSIDLIEETFGKGESYVKCPVTQKLVLLSKMAPDITLSSVSSNKKILKEDLLHLEEIGIGGFARVFKGIYKSETIAIKQLNFERMDLIDSTTTNQIQINNSANSSPSSLSFSSTSLPPPPVNNLNSNNNNNTINGNILAQSSNKILQRNLSASSLSSNSSNEDSLNQVSQSKLSAIYEFRREVWLMSGLSHPNIVQMKGFCFEPYSIIMEYMNLGNLSIYLKKKKEEGQQLSWSLVLKIAIDIASGMAFLHNITPPLVHRDLKSPNILLATDPNDPSNIIAKLSDFGLSRTVVQSFVSKVVDNPTWLAPEVLKGFEYNEKGDIYSYGMILWELYHMELPFEEFDFKFMSTLEDNILSGLRPSINQNCNRMYASLITKCWSSDPNLRPSFNSILKSLKEIKEQ
ncbi:roco8, ROCO family protein [Dictyostelium purpureum]|uniref:non-specific serine/threonine protein kinase n=1 Tax=Dictyostelium purpureum TaxID=5786 RepID=F0ZSM8_DICPU|nr:roco8, ROCO family protein [Dictyostelium purpureum]EGC33072.1 roco8, ROCO family protein [Dictyostelium purpureum]|eukprot:XP_003290422.1 roco8, ROCO family protein [Dictyostelium purpureum]